MLIQPLFVRVFFCDRSFHFLIGNNPAFLRIYKQHTSGTQTIFIQNILSRNVKHPYLGGKNDQVVFCYVITGRSQTVPVKDRSDLNPVSKAHSCRTIPRLHQRAVVFIKCFFIWVHILVADPWLRHHHHSNMRKGASAEIQEFKRIIKHCCIGTIRIDDRLDLFKVMTKHRSIEQRLTGMHPVYIPAESVNLSIVNHKAIRVRPFPAWERVRTEAGVDQSHRGFKSLILQIEIELANLLGGEHAFVHDFSARHAGNIEAVSIRSSPITNREFSASANNIQLAFKIKIIDQIFIATDEHLSYIRFSFFRRFSQHIVTSRYRSISNHPLPFILDNSSKLSFLGITNMVIMSEEKHANSVLSSFGKLVPKLMQFSLEEAMWNLQ
ncbi:hypothetical protein D3C76_721710 [compost metagenome]